MKPRARRSLAKPRLRVPAPDIAADPEPMRVAVSSTVSSSIVPEVPSCVDSVVHQPASSSPTSSPAPPTPPLPFSVLYLFAGPERKTDIGSCLRAICRGKNIPLNIIELDLCRDPSHDLSNPALWSEVLGSTSWRVRCYYSFTSLFIMVPSSV